MKLGKELRLAGRAFMARIGRTVHRLFKAELSQWMCTSILGDKRLELPAHYLVTAQELEIQFTVSWPPLARAGNRSVEVALKPSPATGVLRWEQTWSRRRTQVRLRLKAEEAQISRRLRVEVRECGQGEPVGQIEFAQLGQGATQHLRLANLRLDNVQLCVHSGQQRHYSANVPQSSDFVALEFTVPTDSVSPFIGEFETELNLTLLGKGTRFDLGSVPVRLGQHDLRVTAPRLALTDRTFFPAPGSYHLVVSVGERELAWQSFRLVSEAEVLQQLRVSRMHIGAQRRNGKTVRGLKVLRWEEHQAILPWMQVESGMIAPNTSVRCIIRAFQGKNFLSKEVILLRLDRHSHLVRLRRMELAGLGLPARTKPSRISLSVQWGGEQKASLAVVVLPPERLTNWEGQLKVDARHLPLDDGEYEQIVRGLGVRDRASTRGRFWQWLTAIGAGR